MEWLATNWGWVVIGFVAAEKIVKVSPCKWDDILVDGLKDGINKVMGKDKNKVLS
jgi:hypothetical protein